MTSQGALVHLITMVLPSDSTALTDFFNHFGILDLVDFMSLTEVDFKETYSNNVSESNYLTPMLVKKLLSVQSWYAAQMSSFPDVFEDVDTFFLLTAASFNDWRRSQNHIRITATPLMFDPSPVTSYDPAVVSSSTELPAPTPTAPVPSFQRNVKINVADYPKLKDESQWRTFNRTLRTTAASHDTLDILTPNFVPLVGLEEDFERKQRFMYNVFTNIILTSKGKVCVRAEYDSMNAQKVYASLLAAYNDQLSTQLNATKLRSELTIMKLDDKWRKGFETFLHHWTSKVQELETITDKAIDDETKRIWLTNTLQGQKDMDAAIRQAITTELTIGGFRSTSVTTTIPWANFYNMVLSTAKMLDSSREKQTGRQQDVNQQRRD